MSGRVFLRACERGLKKSFEPKAGAKRSQRLRAGHRRSKSEGQKEKQIERFSRTERSGVLFGGHRRWPGRREGGCSLARGCLYLQHFARLSVISGEYGKIRA